MTDAIGQSGGSCLGVFGTAHAGDDEGQKLDGEKTGMDDVATGENRQIGRAHV